MKASPSTLLRYVRGSPEDAPPLPTAVGIDDWAFRRGGRYGTMIVDLERHEVIDLLEDREARAVRVWLERHPQIRIIARDRGGAYAEATTKGAPQAVQVADRWHLMHRWQQMSGVLYVVILTTALGCGLVAGVFFAFSTFVMAALKRIPPAEGIAAMQSINVMVVTPAFMAALFGAAIAFLGLVVWVMISPGAQPTVLVLAGCALYLVGTVGVTIVCNVPLNDRLAKLHPRDADAASVWDEYLATWTAWNHAPTAASLTAAALLSVALLT